MPDTPPSLLIRLRDAGDQRSWQQFFDQYWRLIYHFARACGLKSDDAQDVLQEVVTDVFKAMPRFEYDRSKGTFRRYLRTVTQRKVSSDDRRSPARECAVIHIIPLRCSGGMPMIGLVSTARVAMRRRLCILLIITGIFVAGCQFFIATENRNTGPAIDPNQPPVTSGNWFRPAVTARWQWQLQPDANGQINMTYQVEVYDIDLFDTPDATIVALHAQGRRVIAYFSAGTSESFRSDFGEFQASDLGNTLADHPTERWLDIRSANVRRIMLARLDRAVARGFDGVEPDNVDGYTNNPGFALTAEDQLAFNRFLANEAHLRGLAVGLKNDLDQIPQLVSYFDFAVNEQCHEFNECEALQPFIDVSKPVFNAEYKASFVNDTPTRNQVCADSHARNIRTLVLPVALDDSFRLSCDP